MSARDWFVWFACYTPVWAFAWLASRFVIHAREEFNEVSRERDRREKP